MSEVLTIYYSRKGENYFPEGIRTVSKYIMVPNYFAMCNDKKRYNSMTSGIYYSNLAMLHGKASECIGCGLCEKHCPQHLPIREHLKEVAAAFET